MYLSHYNLVEKPFQITTDPRFLWLGEKHQEALAMLKYGVLDSRGFLLLTGDVGTGKTTLINALLRDLDSNTIVATVVDPNLERLEFFNFLATAFEIEDKFARKVDFLVSFTQFLNNTYANQKEVLLIIDEAQKLSTELLEEIRLLSNIERENTKLLNIFFVGQNEFKKTLMKNECRALRQRIAIIHQIYPLTESETTKYIKYRLKVAGAEKEIFTKKAIREIYAFSCGYPRLINIICDHALLTGYVRGLKTISPAIINECAQELVIPGETGQKDIKGHTTGKQVKKPLRRVALYACLLPVIAFCVYLVDALRHSNDIQYHANHPSQEFSSPEGLNSNQAGGIQAQGQQPSMSRPLIPPKERVGGDTDMVITKQDTTHTARTNLLNDHEQPLLPGDLNLIIHFDYNTNELSAKAYDILNRFAVVVVENSDIEIIVRGYTDTLGSYRYNKKLSELRANTVKSYMVAKGISPMRIQAIGIGEENPLKPNTSVTGRRANRRVEIEVGPGNNIK